MAGALIATVVGAIVIVRVIPRVPVAQRTETGNSGLSQAVNRSIGVTAKLTSGSTTVRRRMPALSFTVDVDESLDERLPAGVFEGEFEVTFQPGAVRMGRIGAEITGGTLVVRRDGERVIDGEYAGAESRVVLSEPLFLPPRPVTFTFEFNRDPEGLASLRALWQPENSTAPLALPSTGGALFADDAARGLAVVQQFNCAACHISDDADLQRLLSANAAPVLDDVGARARPEWIRQWITDPQSQKRDVAMPALFHSDNVDREAIDDLSHFVASLGGPLNATPDSPSTDLVNTGMVLYHQVGCVACHGPLETLDTLPGRQARGSALQSTYTPLGPLASKTTVDDLAAFLRDPVRFRPSGRMPSQRLTMIESQAIASYLIDRDRRERGSLGFESFVVDEARAARGRKFFMETGCANCHDVTYNDTMLEPALQTASLERIAEIAAGADTLPGCLSTTPPKSAPRFRITPFQRDSIVAFLSSLLDRESPISAHDRLAATIDRLNCLACHTFHGGGGPERGVAAYFTTVGEVDLGDEGRLPPDLSDVGAKLNRLWFHQLLGEGAVSRPYMATRMPQFGRDNVAELPELFEAAAGVDGQPDDGPEFELAAAGIGRRLTGATGLNCIQCHSIAGRESTDTAGPDLTAMPERLTYDFFRRWLHDPKLLSPGTRMPTFFLNNLGNPEYYGGDAEQQIAALWAYLQQGDMLPLPEGLPDPESFVLDVVDEPLVFRTFMMEIGPRAIAVGFPEQVHCAFDAQTCRLGAAWEGRFLSAQGAWGGRGGSETNPAKGYSWSAPHGPMFVIADQMPAPWPGVVAEGSVRFIGYELDDVQRPTFNYQVRGPDGATVTIADQPIPVLDGAEALLRREIHLFGSPDTRIFVNIGGHRLLDQAAQAVAQDDPQIIELLLDSNGEATVQLEVTW